MALVVNFFITIYVSLPTKEEEILGNWVCCPLNFIISSSSSSSIFAQKLSDVL
jgi:hypothetical protein